MNELSGENKDLKLQVKSMQGKISQLADNNIALQDEIFALKANLDLTRGEMSRVSTHQSLLKAAIREQHRPSAAAEPCAFQIKRRKDMALEPSVFAKQTEEMLRKALCVTSPEARLARKSSRDLFRFLLKEFYRSPQVIQGMKLKPAPGASKEAVQRFAKGDGNFMDQDVCTAILKLGVEFFPEVLTTLRDARKILTSVLLNLSTKAGTSEPLDVQRQGAGRSYLDDLPSIMDAGQSSAELSSTPMSKPLRVLKNEDNCLFDTPSPNTLARTFQDVSPIGRNVRPSTVIMSYQTPEEAENAFREMGHPLSNHNQDAHTTLNDSACVSSSDESF